MIGSDVVIVGGGIAGLSLAAALAPRARVTLLEREPALFAHTSGRSAQQSQPTYGPAPIRRLTATTLRLLGELPGDLVTSRPLIWLDLAGRAARIPQLRDEIEGLTPIEVRDAVAAFPALRSSVVAGSALDPASVEVDVPALRDLMRAQAERHGARIDLGHGVLVARRDRDGWILDTAAESYRAAIVVVAAGPWADEAAALFGATPFGLTPTRRTVIVAPPGGTTVDPRAPMLMDTGSTFYLRPRGDAILASALEDEPSVAEDAQPRAEVLRRTIDVINRVTRLELGEPTQSWTGLRTLSRDGLPVVGPDPSVPGLYWLVGQGGYGIQTCLGLAAAVAGDLADDALDDSTAADLAALSPARFAG